MWSTTEQNPWIIFGSGRTKVQVLPSPPPRPLVLVPLVLVHQLLVQNLLRLEEQQHPPLLLALLDTRPRSCCFLRPVETKGCERK